MIDGLIKNMEEMIRNSVSAVGHTKVKVDGLKKCVALMEDDWKCVAGNYVGQSPNAIELVWKKEGYEDENVVLAFGEQQIWLAYLEGKNK